MSNSIREPGESQASAPGKVNLFFQVGSLLENGYHEVASIYQSLSLEERVRAAPADDWQVNLDGWVSDHQLESVPRGVENLVVRAALALADFAGMAKPNPVSFSIYKRVPVAGGMGGGSADAAAALVALNQLWKLNLDQGALLEIAAKLGADVPFALTGGTALGLGSGIELTQISAPLKLHWVLVTSDDGLSTPKTFAELDRLRAAAGFDIHNMPTPKAPAELIEALAKGDLAGIARGLHNDLQLAAFSLRPELAEVLEQGELLGALGGMVSGSGPTVALLCDSKESAERIAAELPAHGHEHGERIATFGPSAGSILAVND